jgi:Ca2+-binding RTX toxin-like protein
VITVGSGASVTTTGQTDGFVFTAGSGNETIVSGDGNDSVTAGLGNDFILTGAGADTVDGGAGTDTVSYADFTGAASHNLAIAPATSGIAVNLSNDAFLDATGALGALFVGSVGSTGLAAGTAEYLVAAAGDKNAQFDTDVIRNVETVIGSALADIIVLGAGGMTATGGLGADSMIGGSGNDTFNADETDIIDGGDGTDTAVFTAAVTAAALANGDLTNVENISISGAFAFDFSAQTEALTITSGNDITNVTGSAGANTITTGTAADIILGGAAADTINSGDGNDNINGSAGNDVINAGAGNDIIIGGIGLNTLTGGAGIDTFVLTDHALAAGAAAGLALAADFDVITDFEVGVDRLDVAAGAAAPFTPVIAGAIVQTNLAAAVTRTDGVTVESFLISNTGVVTLFDETATVGTTEVFAETTDDMLLIAQALRDEATNADEVFIFKVDADGDGVAESSFVVSENSTDANVQYVQLVGVAAADLSLTQVAGDIHLI